MSKKAKILLIAALMMMFSACSEWKTLNDPVQIKGGYVFRPPKEYTLQGDGQSFSASKGDSEGVDIAVNVITEKEKNESYGADERECLVGFYKMMPITVREEWL